MSDYPIVSILDHPELVEPAAEWFHQSWHIPKNAYLESMEDCLKGEAAVPQWYAAVEGARIVGGLGVIENDFHDRKDLTPNICAVYTEEDRRGRGIAGALLRFACGEMAARGVDTLYLLTDHTGFYERYGWQFLTMVQGDGEARMSRMYRHKTGD